jgi:pimeloyl-ACP methyl ester carboxylesterase
MQRSALGRLACSLLVGLALVEMPQRSHAAETERVKFDTIDDVEIHGTFYASPKGNKAPCAMLLHPIGGNIQMKGWDELAARLQKEGFAVLAFDFRGHGDSTGVGQRFWLDPVNRTLKGYRPDKRQISYKEFTTLYNYGMLANDIAAGKRFLDRKNDSGECNSANLVVIGAESGATLGALWIASEWKHRRLTTALPIVTPTGNQMEGQDIACAVWLSISPELSKGYRVSADSWLRAPVREKVPMFFLYGDGDNKALNYSKHLFETVLRADKDKDKQLKYTIMRPVKDTKLSGRELLGHPDLDTEKMITTYATKVLEDRRSNAWSRRDADKIPPYRVPIQLYLH